MYHMLPEYDNVAHVLLSLILERAENHPILFPFELE